MLIYFFVISGYLISGIIFRGMIDKSFSYVDFYIKRIRRIIPNLVLVLVAVLAFGYWVLFSFEYSTVGAHSFSSAFFIQNFKLLKEADDYFALDAHARPLLHLWSLSIEEQFYIIFPIACIVLWKLSRQSISILGKFIGIVVISSFIACVSIPSSSLAFYLPLTRFWELGVGIVLAYIEVFAIFEVRKINSSIRFVMSILGFILILVAFFLYKPEFRTPGWISLTPILGTVLLIASYEDAFVNRTLLSWKVMTFIGLISYSLYLWHWPFLSYLSFINPSAGNTEKFLVLLLSFIVATLIYRYVENPLRRTKSFSGGKLATVLMVCLAVCAGWGLAVRTSQGVPNRNINKIYPFAENRADFVNPWDVLIKEKINGADVYVTDKNSFPEILFIGDSHSYQYTTRVKSLANQFGKTAAFLTQSDCLITTGYSARSHYDPVCRKASQDLKLLLGDSRFKHIVVAQYWSNYLNKVPNLFDKALGIMQSWDVYEQLDRRVFVVLDYPCQQGYLLNSFDINRLFPQALNEQSRGGVPYPKSDMWKVANQRVQNALKDKAIILETESYVCQNNKCDVLNEYRDDHHLRSSFLQKDGVWIDRVFDF